MPNDAKGLVASVIIPVYNKAKYLPKCFETLDGQTIDHALFEAIFVDDGSKDDSLATLRDYAASHPWVKVIAKSNGGVCSARDAGIDAATGRFIFYLDPDDELTPNTLEVVSSCFEEHYEQTDVFTYPIVPYVNGVEMPMHARYETLVSDGIYDLTDKANAFICQTTMNVCVKNQFENNRHFDYISTNGVVFHEDQQYITEIVLDRLTIGFCSQAQYIWNQDDRSSSNSVLNPYYIYDNTMILFENLFRRFEGEVPAYLQGLFVNDISWKMWRNATLPTHLSGEAYEEALERLRLLLDRVDDDVILSYPYVSAYHTTYFISLKHGAKFTPLAGSRGVALARDGALVYADDSVEICILRTRIHDGVVDVVGVVKCPLLLYSDYGYRLVVRRAGASATVTEHPELSFSGTSYAGARVPVARHLSFRHTIPMNEESVTTFLFEIDGHVLHCHFTQLEGHTNFCDKVGTEAHVGMYAVYVGEEAGIIKVTPIDRNMRHYRRTLLNHLLDGRVHLARATIQSTSALMHRRYKAVWLYLDAPGRLDNAWLQFVHDAPMDDGIMRFYVANGVETGEFGKAPNAKVIQFGSREHKTLHFVADKRICSDIEWRCISPWEMPHRQNYADFDNAELVYVQHGVLWAHMPWYYSYDRVLFDREVVSTQFEIDNLTQNYGFRTEDLIACGMPRYDKIEHEQPANKRILFCPSWRPYLIGALTSSGREPLPEKFVASEYYQGIAAILHDERLKGILEQHGYALDLKLHPNFACYVPLFGDLDGPVSIVEKVENESSYAVIITDYSSYSFDFVYLNRAIIYYIPDEEMFHSGVANYSTLDMDLNDAMGAYVKTPDEVVDAIAEILANDGKPLPRYAEKEQSFFLHYDNQQCDRLYQALCER